MAIRLLIVTKKYYFSFITIWTCFVFSVILNSQHDSLLCISVSKMIRPRLSCWCMANKDREMLMHSSPLTCKFDVSLEPLALSSCYIRQVNGVNWRIYCFTLFSVRLSIRPSVHLWALRSYRQKRRCLNPGPLRVRRSRKPLHYGSGLCNGVYTFLNACPTTSQQK